MGWAKCMEDNLRICDRREESFSAVRCDYFPVLVSDEVIGESRLYTFHSQQYTPEKKKEYHDRILECRSCGCDFRYSAKKQEEYEKKGWQDPKRCWNCREEKRTVRTSAKKKPNTRKGPASYGLYITWATSWVN